MAPELLANDGGGFGGGGDGDDDGWMGGGAAGAGAGAVNGGLPDDLVQFVPGDENPLVTFFRSLLPWNVVVPNDRAEHE